MSTEGSMLCSLSNKFPIERCKKLKQENKRLSKLEKQLLKPIKDLISFHSIAANCNLMQTQSLTMISKELRHKKRQICTEIKSKIADK